MSILNQSNNASDVNTKWFNKYTWTLDNGLEYSSSNNFMVTNSSLKKIKRCSSLYPQIFNVTFVVKMRTFCMTAS